MINLDYYLTQKMKEHNVIVLFGSKEEGWKQRYDAVFVGL